MFFKQIRRNAARNRKNNGLLFGSLIIAIVAFYTLLSLESQDVMRFLRTMESDAVGRLMMLVPFVYVISLFFVFFLVYFAYRYQLENRRKELGLYLMLGMKQSRLFAMLMSETLVNSLISVLAGLPIALLLTEAISLTTAKVIGLGIIGHKISFSLSAVLWTVVGFIIVQMVSMLMLCMDFTRREPMELMKSDASGKQTTVSAVRGGISFVAGVLLLLVAYGAGIFLLRSLYMFAMIFILLPGALGTFLLYKGMGAFIGGRIRKKSPDKSGLYSFTGRQIQENVIHQYKSLAVASLLLLMAMACVSYGIGTAAGRGSAEVRSTDFSILGTQDEVAAVMAKDDLKDMIDTYYPMYLGHMDMEVHEVSTDGLMEALQKQPADSLRDNMIENMSGRAEYFIKESSFNKLLAVMGKEPLKLGEHQMAAYTSMKDSADFVKIMNGALQSGAWLAIDGVRYELAPQIYTENVVADRQITLYIAYIMPDAVYEALVRESDVNEAFCWNASLKPEVVEAQGLMQAISSAQDILSRSGLSFESYLSGIGRNLFYTVASSYLTIYLGVLFMIIANTVIGLKFLMQQRSGRERYVTLLMLGAGKRELFGSARKQIRMFFFLVIGVAGVSSVFAVWSMFTSFLKLPAATSPMTVFLLAAIAFFILIVVEFIYIRVVERASRRELSALRVADRRNAL